MKQRKLYYGHLISALFAFVALVGIAANHQQHEARREGRLVAKAGSCMESVHQCLNGGQCTNARNSTYCKCPGEWFGARCQYRKCPEQSASICENGGLCEKTEKSFKCHCPLGYNGTHCSERLETACSSNPCKYGTCALKESLSDYKCLCYYGFTGRDCSKIDYCSERTAFCSHGHCENLADGYRCVCDPGWHGEACDDDADECRHNPCLNDGDCVNQRGTYYCNCSLDFGGRHCELRIDPTRTCTTNAECMNGGKCSADRVKCDCPDGFYGAHCERRRDPCEDGVHHCINGGACISAEDGVGASCKCMAGYSGEHCEEKLDECQVFEGVCQNGAACESYHGSYHCICMGGYTGRHCETNIDDCEHALCYAGSTCVDDVGRFQCVCAEGRIGMFCEHEDPCYGEAGERNCPKGICVSLESGNHHCELEVDKCAVNPDRCLHGSCVSAGDSYYCECNAGYTGPECATLVDYCVGDPCQGHGTCMPFLGHYQCACLPGFTGKHCETRNDDDVFKCHLNCQNGGMCRNAAAQECECPPAYAGILCELEKPDPCEGNQCSARSLCVPSSDYSTYTCECPDHMHGERCELPVRQCDYDPCVHGVCRQRSSSSPSTSNSSSISTSHCKCYAGYEGELCDRRVQNHCHPTNPCLNAGHCISQADNFKCTCRTGFTGLLCDVALPEVHHSPKSSDDCRHEHCHNGGACEKGELKYECRCRAGYEGRLCEINTNECLPGPCLNKGVCVDLINSYRCDCAKGWTGDHCEIDIDDCAGANVCANEGMCVDKVADFECRCRRGFVGRYCETYIDFDKYNKLEDKDREECRKNDCDAKSKNGVCDMECNHHACDYDGGDCSAGIPNPFGECAEANYCARKFGDKYCDDQCNNEKCLFDGHDCDDAGKAGRCDLDYCASRFGDGHCDATCDTEKCGWDGGDCNQTATHSGGGGLLADELALVLIVPNDEPAYLIPTLRRFLLALSAQVRASMQVSRDEQGRLKVFHWSSKGGKGEMIEIKESDLVAGVTATSDGRRRYDGGSGDLIGIYILLKIDMSGCAKLHPNIVECFSHVEDVANYLAAENATRKGTDGTGVQIHTIIKPPTKKPGWHPLLVAVTILMIMAIVLMVAQLSGVTRKRKAHSTGLWIPKLHHPLAGHDKTLIGSTSARCVSSNSATLLNPAESLYALNNAYAQHNFDSSSSFNLGSVPLIGQPSEHFRHSSFPRVDLPLPLYNSGCSGGVMNVPNGIQVTYRGTHYDTSLTHPEAAAASSANTASVASSSTSGIGSGQQSPDQLHLVAPHKELSTDHPLGGKKNRLHEFIGNEELNDDVVRNGIEEFFRRGDVGDAVDARDERGTTPLILAIKKDRGDIVHLLLSKDADPNMMDGEDKTPLHHAVSRLAVGAVRYLLMCKDAGLDVDSVSRRRETPLMRCVQMGSSREALEIAHLLIEAGADVNKTADKDCAEFNRRTALHIAASLNNVELMRVLLSDSKNQANLEAADIDNRTPLFLAAANGQKEAVEFLLARGARSEHTDNTEKEAATVAAESGYTAVAKLIQDRSQNNPNHRSRIACSTALIFQTGQLPKKADGIGAGGANPPKTSLKATNDAGDEYAVVAKRPRIGGGETKGVDLPYSSYHMHLHQLLPLSSSVQPSPPTLTPPNSDQSTSAYSSTPSPNHSVGLMGMVGSSQQHYPPYPPYLYHPQWSKLCMAGSSTAAAPQLPSSTTGQKFFYHSDYDASIYGPLPSQLMGESPPESLGVTGYFPTTEGIPNKQMNTGNTAVSKGGSITDLSGTNHWTPHETGIMENKAAYARGYPPSLINHPKFSAAADSNYITINSSQPQHYPGLFHYGDYPQAWLTRQDLGKGGDDHSGRC